MQKLGKGVKFGNFSRDSLVITGPIAKQQTGRKGDAVTGGQPNQILPARPRKARLASVVRGCEAVLFSAFTYIALKIPAVQMNPAGHVYASRLCSRCQSTRPANSRPARVTHSGRENPYCPTAGMTCFSSLMLETSLLASLMRKVHTSSLHTWPKRACLITACGVVCKCRG